jgi:hypothetical protein
MYNVSGNGTIRALYPHVEKNKKSVDCTGHTFGSDYAPFLCSALSFIPPNSRRSTESSEDQHVYYVEEDEFLLDTLKSLIIYVICNDVAL